MQDKDGAKNRPEIEDYLNRAGLLNTSNPAASLIDPATIRVSREGITYAISNVTQFNAALKSSRYAIDLNTKFGGQHNNQVGKPSVDNRFRTGTKADKLGPKSLQVVVGPAGAGGAATGYSDIDCNNPAQSFWSALKHIF